MSTSFWSLNSWGQDILGPFYSAATGKVDPWTKNILVENQTQDNLKAQGVDPSLASQDQIDTAKARATSDVETTLATAPNPSVDCSNTGNDFLAGLNCSVKKFENYIIIILIVLIAIYLLGKQFSSPRLIVRGGT